MPATPSGTITGLRLQLKRTVDKPCVTCGESTVVIGEGVGPHVASLWCAGCDRHRGWLPNKIAHFLAKAVRAFGVPSEPFIIRDACQTRPNFKR